MLLKNPFGLQYVFHNLKKAFKMLGMLRYCWLLNREERVFLSAR